MATPRICAPRTHHKLSGAQATRLGAFSTPLKLPPNHPVNSHYCSAFQIWLGNFCTMQEATAPWLGGMKEKEGQATLLPETEVLR